MHGVIQSPAAEIIAEPGRNGAGKGPLAIDRIGALENVAAHRRLLGRCQQRDQRILEDRRRDLAAATMSCPAHRWKPGHHQDVRHSRWRRRSRAASPSSVRAAAQTREIVGGARLGPGSLSAGLEISGGTDQMSRNARQRRDRSRCLLHRDLTDITIRNIAEARCGHPRSPAAPRRWSQDRAPGRPASRSASRAPRRRLAASWFANPRSAGSPHKEYR